jgi:GTPase SAR1 family protein
MSTPQVHTFKVVLVGSSGVGKTTILSQLVHHVFREDGQPTIGIDFRS